MRRLSNPDGDVIPGVDDFRTLPDPKTLVRFGDAQLFCDNTNCCTRVCPEHIQITDDAIIPLNERVVDRFDDPVTRLLRMVTG